MSAPKLKHFHEKWKCDDKKKLKLEVEQYRELLIKKLKSDPALAKKAACIIEMFLHEENGQENFRKKKTNKK